MANYLWNIFPGTLTGVEIPRTLTGVEIVHNTDW
jgi:hypothetical protein